MAPRRTPVPRHRRPPYFGRADRRRVVPCRRSWPATRCGGAHHITGQDRPHRVQTIHVLAGTGHAHARFDAASGSCHHWYRSASSSPAMIIALISTPIIAPTDTPMSTMTATIGQSMSCHPFCREPAPPQLAVDSRDFLPRRPGIRVAGTAAPIGNGGELMASAPEGIWHEPNQREAPTTDAVRGRSGRNPVTTSVAAFVIGQDIPPSRLTISQPNSDIESITRSTIRRAWVGPSGYSTPSGPTQSSVPIVSPANVCPTLHAVCASASSLPIYSATSPDSSRSPLSGGHQSSSSGCGSPSRHAITLRSPERLDNLVDPLLDHH